MIDPSECFAGPISAAHGLTLVLPRSQYERACLIVPKEEKLVCVCLEEFNSFGRFFAFECDDNDNWQGLLIPAVRMELDETSLHSSDGWRAPRGSMARTQGELTLAVEFEGQFHTRNAGVTILVGLPLCSPHQTACFLKWQVVLGNGDGKRVLWKVDVTPAES